jgi:hypothetical protein
MRKWIYLIFGGVMDITFHDSLSEIMQEMEEEQDNHHSCDISESPGNGIQNLQYKVLESETGKLTTEQISARRTSSRTSRASRTSYQEFLNAQKQKAVITEISESTHASNADSFVNNEPENITSECQSSVKREAIKSPPTCSLPDQLSAFEFLAQNPIPEIKLNSGTNQRNNLQKKGQPSLIGKMFQGLANGDKSNLSNENSANSFHSEVSTKKKPNMLTFAENSIAHHYSTYGRRNSVSTLESSVSGQSNRQKKLNSSMEGLDSFPEDEEPNSIHNSSGSQIEPYNLSQTTKKEGKIKPFSLLHKLFRAYSSQKQLDLHISQKSQDSGITRGLKPDPINYADSNDSSEDPSKMKAFGKRASKNRKSFEKEKDNKQETKSLAAIDPNLSVLGELPLFESLCSSVNSQSVLPISKSGTIDKQIGSICNMEENTKGSKPRRLHSYSLENSSAQISPSSPDEKLNPPRRRSSSLISKLKITASKLQKITIPVRVLSPKGSEHLSNIFSEPEDFSAATPIIPILKSPTVAFHENKQVELIQYTRKRGRHLCAGERTPEIDVDQKLDINPFELERRLSKVLFKPEIEVIPNVENVVLNNLKNFFDN